MNRLSSWCSALYDDVSLYIVPGSHRVSRTAAQRALSSDTAPADPLAMPGAIGVHLRGSDVAYSRMVPCLTRHCSGRIGILQQQYSSLRLVQPE